MWLLRIIGLKVDLCKYIVFYNLFVLVYWICLNDRKIFFVSWYDVLKFGISWYSFLWLSVIKLLNIMVYIIYFLLLLIEECSVINVKWFKFCRNGDKNFGLKMVICNEKKVRNFEKFFE